MRSRLQNGFDGGCVARRRGKRCAGGGLSEPAGPRRGGLWPRRGRRRDRPRDGGPHEPALGQQLVVENSPGAGSSLGAEYVARAPKDGYTLLMCTVAQTINPALNKLSFDFGKDLAPITLVANAPQMLVAHPSFRRSTRAGADRAGKAKPEEIQYASSGVGTMSHLSGVLLNSAAGIKLQQMPYPGSAQSMTDVLAGRVPLMFGPAATVWPNVQAGKLKALAVTQPKRAAIAPDVPTMVEAGVPGYSAGIWMGLLAPAGTPPEIVDKLSHAANEALKSNEVLIADAHPGRRSARRHARPISRNSSTPN